MTAIEFEDISKQYRLGLVSTRMLSHDLNRFWQTKVLRHENSEFLQLKLADYNGYKNRTYQGVKAAFENQKFDFILVDGPFGSEHYSRSQITQLAKSNLAETFCTIINDCNRIGEQETVAEVKNVLKRNNIRYAINKYYGLSDYVVICSEDLKFLTSL